MLAAVRTSGLNYSDYFCKCPIVWVSKADEAQLENPGRAMVFINAA
jgi:hypothetical protein